MHIPGKAEDPPGGTGPQGHRGHQTARFPGQGLDCGLDPQQGGVILLRHFWTGHPVGRGHAPGPVHQSQRQRRVHHPATARKGGSRHPRRRVVVAVLAPLFPFLVQQISQAGTGEHLRVRRQLQIEIPASGSRSVRRVVEEQNRVRGPGAGRFNRLHEPGHAKGGPNRARVQPGHAAQAGEGLRDRTGRIRAEQPAQDETPARTHVRFEILAGPGGNLVQVLGHDHGDICQVHAGQAGYLHHFVGYSPQVQGPARGGHTGCVFRGVFVPQDQNPMSHGSVFNPL